ncbi:MAG: molybdenum cofactor biosynthesis protein MoaE [Planctomycetota bacterium]|nr:molybdenum cofactor biosynthesis protein MoaE [Planctomycetota bacterium]
MPDPQECHLAQLVNEPIPVEKYTRWLGEPGCGAVLLFCGNVRDTNRGQSVIRIDYHAHESMARKQLTRITASLVEAGAHRALAIHRLGTLEVGETSILLGVSLAHRRDGFGLLEQGMERIKADVPIWKHEQYQDGTVAWIEGS